MPGLVVQDYKSQLFKKVKAEVFKKFQGQPGSGTYL